jgi:hypothetical protein
MIMKMKGALKDQFSAGCVLNTYMEMLFKGVCGARLTPPMPSILKY